MPSVELDPDTYRAVAFAARAADKTPAQIIAMAIESYIEVASTSSPTQPSPAAPGPIRVYGTYYGHRVDGEFNPATQAVTVLEGQAAGKTFRSPSAAGRAVVKAINPSRDNVAVNGWRFWRVATTRRTLESIR